MTDSEKSVAPIPEGNTSNSEVAVEVKKDGEKDY